MKPQAANYLGTTRLWWLLLIAGILLIIGGFAYWFWPGIGYLVAAQLFGWLLVVVGVVQLCVAAGPHSPKGRGWWIIGGILDMFIGFTLIRNILVSATILPYFFAIVFIFWGIEAFVGGIIGRRIHYRWLSVINGILLCFIGYFFLEAGFVSDMFMVSFLTAIAFIYWGFTVAITAYELKP